MRNHGDALRSCLHSAGIHGHCQVSVQRSGWGMIARWRPSGEQRAAIPSGEPLGFRGYCVVGGALIVDVAYRCEIVGQDGGVDGLVGKLHLPCIEEKAGSYHSIIIHNLQKHQNVEWYGIFFDWILIKIHLFWQLNANLWQWRIIQYSYANI